MEYNIGLFNESFPPTIDGVANTIKNYADIITKNHGKCTVVTPYYPNVVDDYEYDVVRYSSITVSKQLEYRVANPVPVRTLTTLLNKDFDLLHVHSPFVSSLVAAELVKLKPAPIVFTYHTKFDVELEKRFKSKSFKHISKNFIKNNINTADEVWVVSTGAKESLRKIGYKGKCRVIRNGVDFEKGKASAQAVENLKKKLGIEKDELVFLYVGRMMWYKNIKLTMDALRLLPTDQKYKMVFVGDGNDLNSMKDYAKRIGIDKKCVFVGPVREREELRVHYSLGDLFLFPSTYDTSGLVVMEAAATALPSIVIDSSCAAEIVTDMRNGFLCDENEVSLKDAIVRATSDRERLAKIGENAQNEVYFSWDDAVELAYSRYEEIIKEFHTKRKIKKKFHI